MERMRITWLLEATDPLAGEIKVALAHANWLHRRGHCVIVCSRSGPPDWMRLQCGFQQVSDFRAEHLPDADVIVGTLWATIPWAACAGAKKGVPVHFCQSYEGDHAGNELLRERIEAAYRLPGVQHVTNAAHVTALLAERFQIAPRQIGSGFDYTDQLGEELEAALRACIAGAAARERAPLQPASAPGEREAQILAGLVMQLKAAGVLMRMRKQPQTASRLFAAALSLAPEDLDLVRLAARSHLETGSPAEALRLYDDLAERGVDDEPLLVARAQALHAVGRLHEAAQEFRAALATGTRSADVYNQLGVVLFEAGDLRGARHSFERALALQPGHGEARANLAALPAA